MENKNNIAILKLFKGYVGKSSTAFDRGAISKGVLISEEAGDELIQKAIKLYGINAAELNQTFHKSWSTVANKSVHELFIEQAIHYLTVYGFEKLGIFDHDTVYIPAEKLEIPELNTKTFKFVNIRPMTEDQVREKLMVLLSSGIALSEDAVEQVKTLSYLLSKDDISKVSNREVRSYLYDKFNIVPEDPEEFLRYLIYKTTGSTLKIQNKDLYEKLRASDKELVSKLLLRYPDPAKLSSIFLRNKNLFLALKTKGASGKPAKEVNHYINRLRKLAEHNHEQYKYGYLDCLFDFEFPENLAKEALDRVTLFRAVRCLNALNYRLSGNSSIVYRVRNGKSFATDLKKKHGKEYKEILKNNRGIIYDYIVSKLSEKVNGKHIYIPKGVFYKAPSSEKQFVGNFPEGSYIELPKDADNLLFAIHWENQGIERVDLDLHMLNESEHFGWNASLKDDKTLFSGDITDAPKDTDGATEAFAVKGINKAFMVTVNNFTHNNNPVPYSFIIGYVKDGQLYINHTIFPDEILHKINYKIDPNCAQTVLGLIKLKDDSKRFYFQNFGAGCARYTKNKGYILKTYDYLNKYNETQVTLNDLLKKAGAIIIHRPTYKDENGEKKDADINLSLESIDKSTIIDLFRK